MWWFLSRTSNKKEAAALPIIMMTRVTRQSWGTHTIWGGRRGWRAVSAAPLSQCNISDIHAFAQMFLFFGPNTRQLKACGVTVTRGENERKVYLQEVVNSREGMQHDEEEKSVQTDAGQHEQPSWKKSYNLYQFICEIQGNF